MTKQFLYQFLPVDIEILGDIAENRA